MVRMCSWCGVYPAMQSIGVDECEMCYHLPGHDGYKELVEPELARLQAENERLRELENLWSKFLEADDRGESQRAADIVEEAAALLAGTPAEDSE